MFFLVLTQLFTLCVPQLLRIGTDAIIASERIGIRNAALGLIAVSSLAAGARILSRILIFNSGRRVECDIRDDLYAHLIGLSQSFFLKMPTGQIMSRAVNDLTQVRLLLGPGILNVTNTSLVYLVVVPFLLYRDWQLALLSLSSLPILVFSGRWMGARIYKLSRSTQERLGALSDRVQENLGGVSTVRVYRREAHETKRFTKSNEHYYEANVRLARLRGVLFPVMGLFGAVGGVVLLYLGGQRVIEGHMSVGEFVEFNAYLAILTWPTIALGWMIALWQRGMASLDRINEIFTQLAEISSGALEQISDTDAAPILEIQDLSFRYPEQDHPALEKISLSIQKGETILIVGKTGSGKSTLLKAITRHLEIPVKSIFLKGCDYTELSLACVRKSFAYAPQEAFLFSRSLKENIQFASPDASDKEIDEAIEQAGLSPDLKAFSDGLNTIIGERGITLSGGQRQRSTLARALIKDAEILVLDDTLSAVDNETEAAILEALANRKSQTTILVTHRLAGTRLADRIVVLDEGQIIEQGSEQELLAQDGVFSQLHRQQRRRQRLESRSESSSQAPSFESVS
jgi:ATP-binding cassette subfamily B multidrug efflux pump